MTNVMQASPAKTGTVIEVEDLVVRNPDLTAVKGVSFSISASERMGIVGESGAGKSMTALALMGLLPDGWWSQGSIIHGGDDITSLGDRAMSSRRGRTMSMIFQDPLTALDPVRRVGVQITDVIRRHTDASKEAAYKQALSLIEQMDLPRPPQVLRAYPHELSGGQRQRIMIAMAISCYPSLVIADEPTTALDVTVQKKVLKMLDRAVVERECALLMITHDLAVIAAMCETVAVMYGGRIVEQGPVQEVFTEPKHPYTEALLRSQPTLDNIDLTGDSRLPSIAGQVPSLVDMPSGCAFRTRCDRAHDACEEFPAMEGGDHRVACWDPVRPPQSSDNPNDSGVPAS